MLQILLWFSVTSFWVYSIIHILHELLTRRYQHVIYYIPIRTLFTYAFNLFKEIRILHQASILTRKIRKSVKAFVINNICAYYWTDVINAHNRKNMGKNLTYSHEWVSMKISTFILLSYLEDLTWTLHN